MHTVMLWKRQRFVLAKQLYWFMVSGILHVGKTWLLCLLVPK
jgi:hypothetical protein